MAKSVLSKVESLACQDHFRLRADVTAAIRRGYLRNVRDAARAAGLRVDDRRILRYRAEFSVDVCTTDGVAVLPFRMGTSDGRITAELKAKCAADGWFENLLAYAIANRGNLLLGELGPITVRDIIIRDGESGPFVPVIRLQRGEPTLMAGSYKPDEEDRAWIGSDGAAKMWRFLVRQLT
jgi:hypothetical protein